MATKTNRDNRTHCIGKGFPPGTPVDHARALSLSLSLSLSTHVTCSPWHVKGRVGVFSKENSGFFTFYLFPLLLRGAPFLYLQPTMASTWELVPLSPICTPYYKSVQIIQ
jgi:hypothetical protein